MSRTEAAHDASTAPTKLTQPPSTSKSSLTIVLVLVCVAVGLYAAFGSAPRTPGSDGVSDGAVVQAEQSVSGDSTADTPQSFGGTVKEVIQVESYTYLRVAPPKGEDLWAAVTKTNTPDGAKVSFESAELMTNFTSKELGRTFDRIYFARLAGGAGLDPERGGEFPAPTRKEGEAARRAASMVAEEVPIRDTRKAPGPLGHTVGEIYEQGKSLAGKKVRVRGTVVRLTRKVMGTNFLHIRDGSGDPSNGSHDLVLKVADAPLQLGEAAEFEGTVAVDVNLGAGYSYPLLLEDARLVSE